MPFRYRLNEHEGMSNAILEASKPAPVCFRLPRVGERDPYFGGSRQFWNTKVLPSLNGGNPPVQSIVVKRPGATRGIRFIVYESAALYFATTLATQEAGE